MTYLPQRVVQVAVGPAGSLGAAWRDLAITAEVEMTAGSSPDKAKVTIYNLSDYSIDYFDQPNLVLQLMAGEGTAGQLFYGDVTRGKVETSKSGADWATTIEAAAGRRIFRDTKFSRSYPPGRPGFERDQILTELLAHARLARGYITPLAPRHYPAGFYFNAFLTDALDELFAGEGVTWAIANGALQVLAGEPVPGNVPIYSPRSGLIGSPKRKSKGVEAPVWFDGSMRPGRGFQVRSRRVKGLFRVTKALHKVSNWDDSWDSTLTGVPV